MKKLIVLLLLLCVPLVCWAEGLKTLEEHEKEFWDNYQSLETLTKTGIACPKCGEELLANYSICLTSYPPQTPVECPKCGWKSSIFFKKLKEITQ